jgi:peptidylprolyl isomerase
LAYLIILGSLVSFGCKSPQAVLPGKSAQTVSPTWSTSPSGLGTLDLIQGEGPYPRIGQTCVVEAMGWIEEEGKKGHVFLDTRKRGFPERFPIGGGRVIKGWEEGLATMKKGGKRLLRVPPDLGYSPRELGHDIPTGSTLVFELDLLDLR